MQTLVLAVLAEVVFTQLFRVVNLGRGVDQVCAFFGSLALIFASFFGGCGGGGLGNMQYPC